MTKTLKVEKILRKMVVLIRTMDIDSVGQKDPEMRERVMKLRKTASECVARSTLEETMKLFLVFELFDRTYQDCVALAWLTHPARSLTPKKAGVQ